MKKKLSLFLSILMVLSVLNFPVLNAKASEQKEQALSVLPEGENVYVLEDGYVEKTIAPDTETNTLAYTPSETNRYIFNNLDAEYISSKGFSVDDLKQVASLKVKNTYIEDRVLVKCGATIDDFFAKTRKDDNFEGYVMTAVGSIPLYDLDEESDYVVGILNTDEQSPIYDVVFAEDNYDGVVLNNEYFDIETGLVYIYKTDLIKFIDDEVYFDYVQAQVLHGYREGSGSTVVSVSVTNDDAKEDKMVVEYKEDIIAPNVVIPLYEDPEEAYDSTLKQKHVDVYLNGSDIPLPDDAYTLSDGCVVIEGSASSINSVSVEVDAPSAFEKFFNNFFNMLSVPAYAYDYSGRNKYPGITLTGNIQVGDYVTFDIPSPGYQNGQGTTSNYVQTWNSTYNDSTYANDFYRYVALKSGGNLESVEHPSNSPYENDYYIPMARQTNRVLGTRSESDLSGRTNNLLEAIQSITSNLNCGCVHASQSVAGSNLSTYRTWHYTAMVTAIDVTNNYVLISFLSSERSENQCLCGSYVFDWKPITVTFEANSGDATKGISQVWQATNDAFSENCQSNTGDRTTSVGYYYYGTYVHFKIKLDTGAVITNTNPATNTYWGLTRDQFWGYDDNYSIVPYTQDGVYYCAIRALYGQRHYINVTSTKTADVIYNANGGTAADPYTLDGSELIYRSGIQARSTGAVGEQIQLLDLGSYLYKENYQFMGWSTTKHTPGIGWSTAINTYTPTAANTTTTVYAVWKVNTNHGIRYTYDDASFDGTPGNLINDKVDLDTNAATYSAPQPSAHGSSFAGYSYEIALGNTSLEVASGAAQYLTEFRQVVPGATYTIQADDVTNALGKNPVLTIEVGYQKNLTWNKIQEITGVLKSNLIKGFEFTVSDSSEMQTAAQEQQLKMCIRCTNGTVTYKNLRVIVRNINDGAVLKANGANPTDNMDIHGKWQNNTGLIRLLNNDLVLSSAKTFYANAALSGASYLGEYAIPNFTIDSAPTDGNNRLTGWTSDVKWTADPGYYKNTAGPIANIYGRLFTTVKDAPIVFAVVNLPGLKAGGRTGYTGPVVLSTDPEAAGYKAVDTDQRFAPVATYNIDKLGSFTYTQNGKTLTWYISEFGAWFPQNTADALGMANKLVVGTDITGTFEAPNSAIISGVGTAILNAANVRYFDDVLMPGTVIKANESEPFDVALSTVWYTPVDISMYTRYGSTAVYSDDTYTTPAALPVPEIDNSLYDFVGYYIDVPAATETDAGHNSVSGAVSGYKRLQVTDAVGNVVDGYIEGVIEDHGYVNTSGKRLYACFVDYITAKSGMTSDMSKSGMKRIDFDLNGGKTANGASGIGAAYVNGSAVYGSMITPVRDGYHFNGWYNGNTKVTDLSVLSSNVTLTANWTAISNANKATVIYRLNDGSGYVNLNLATTTVEKGSSLTVTDISPAQLADNNPSFAGHTFRGNKTFVGWSTDPNAPFRDYRGGDRIQITGDTILYAIWR